MLKIAVIANTYSEAVRFVQYKFGSKIQQTNIALGVTTLKNGDEIYICYDEVGKERYISMVFDAFVVTPTYQSLFDIINSRCQRTYN